MYTIDIIIPAWREEENIRILIPQIEEQIKKLPKKYKVRNIFLITHDKATGRAGLEVQKLGILKHYLVPRYKGGKIASLNKGILLTKVDWVIFMDADVRLNTDTLQNLLTDFEYQTKHYNVGAVTGRPAPLEDDSTMFGFWAHTLTSAAHFTRKRAFNLGKNVSITGNLYIVKHSLLPEKLPKGVYDDYFMTLWVALKGFKVGYSEGAIVKQYFASNYKDWVTQKLRNFAGERYTERYFRTYIVPKFLGTGLKAEGAIAKSEGKSGFWQNHFKNMRSFLYEALNFYITFYSVKRAIHIWWLFLLFLARLHVWVLAYLQESKFFGKGKDIWLKWRKVR